MKKFLKLFFLFVLFFLGLGLFPDISLADILERQIAASNDDVIHRMLISETLEQYTVRTITGNSTAEYKGYGNGFRFTNITIPQGAVISNAYIIFKAYSNQTGTEVKSKFFGQAADTAATFSNLADYNSRTITAATVSWDNISSWVLDAEYNSPSLVSIIQEIINRPGWILGNSIAIFWEDKEMLSNVGARREAYSYNGSPLYAPKLHIEYTSGAPPVCVNCGLTTPTVSPASPNASQAFTITCPTSVSGYDCFDAYVNTTLCAFFQWSGNNAVFNCPGQAVGTYTAKCVEKTGTPSNCCADEKTTSFIVQSAPVDTTPPVISNIQSSNITTNSATITWLTNKLSNSTVNYGPTSALGQTQSSSSYITNHSINLTGLTPNTTYYYQVRSCNSDNYCSDPNDQTFTTQAPVSNNATAVGTLQLLPTIENIGVISSFTGDVNGNNNAILEYRKQGTTAWKPGIEMTPDRRQVVTSYYQGGTAGGSPQPNPYPDSWKASVFFLEPNTNYEVKITYSDSDGIDGTGSVFGTVKTRNDNPPSTDINYYVSTAGNNSNNGLSPSTAWAAIQYASDNARAGDIVNILPGTYNETITIGTNAGTADNYITFRSYNVNDKAVINGGGTATWVVTIRVPYIRFHGIKIQNGGAQSGLIYLDDGGNPDYFIIEDSELSDWGAGWPGAGIFVRGAKYLLAQRNTFTRTRSDLGDNFGIHFVSGTKRNGHSVVKGNNFIGNMKDCVGGAGNAYLNGGSYINTYIYDNYCEGSWDDGIEMEGGDIIIGIWNNTMNATYNTYRGSYMSMYLGIAPVIVGPLYAFRNVGWGHDDAAVKMGSGSNGPAYIYHNTFYTTHSGDGPSNFGSDHVVNNIRFRNNIIRTNSQVFGQYEFTSTNDFDYDYLFSAASTQWAAWVVWLSNFAEVQTIPQELHGIGSKTVEPGFVDPANQNFRLQPNSPSINKGQVLIGFNDVNSPWPYKGSAPDMGAFEYDPGAPPPSIAGDISGPTSGVPDGKVNIYDVSYLFSRWGSVVAADLSKCDINAGPGSISQGKIDLFDANKMMANWLP